MFVGENDILADLTDAEWARDTIGDDVFHFQTIKGGHLSFMIGSDMSYWSEDVMSILNEYQPLPTAAESVTQ